MNTLSNALKRLSLNTSSMRVLETKPVITMHDIKTWWSKDRGSFNNALYEDLIEVRQQLKNRPRNGHN